MVAVYLSDDVSRVMPGRKDCVSFMTAEGKRESSEKVATMQLKRSI